MITQHLVFGTIGKSIVCHMVPLSQNVIFRLIPDYDGVGHMCHKLYVTKWLDDLSHISFNKIDAHFVVNEL